MRLVLDGWRPLPCIWLICACVTSVITGRPGEADFPPGFHLLLGDNAQGKTNILEALYLLATLRSFRGVGSAQMVRHGQKGYFVGAQIVGQAEHDVKIYWSARERTLKPGRAARAQADRLPRRAADGRLLHRRPPTYQRRRAPAADASLTCCSPKPIPPTCPCSNATPRRSVPATPSSNNPSLTPWPSMGSPMNWSTLEIPSSACAANSSPFSPPSPAAPTAVSNQAEELRLEYQPSVKENFTVELAQSGPRERGFRATLVGPHRDDVRFLINDRPAAQYGSEGQKRTLAIALKLAQADYLTGLHGAPPVMLIDDIMGELDVKRRSGLLPLLEQAHQSRGQVFLTATEENWPRELGREVQRWHVRAGNLDKLGPT